MDQQSANWPTLSTKRQKFRAYMKSFNPTAPARDVIRAGLVVEDLHQRLFERLGARADLETGSQQLLVGGIGSGKTTELLLAVNWLRERSSDVSLYVDITAETDLSTLNSGALVAAFGLHLSRYLSSKIASASPAQKAVLEGAVEKIGSFCFGKSERVWVPADDWEPPDEWVSDEWVSSRLLHNDTNPGETQASHSSPPPRHRINA